jgi:hypothetical protein
MVIEGSTSDEVHGVRELCQDSSSEAGNSGGKTNARNQLAWVAETGRFVSVDGLGKRRVEPNAGSPLPLRLRRRPGVPHGRRLAAPPGDRLPRAEPAISGLRTRRRDIQERAGRSSLATTVTRTPSAGRSICKLPPTSRGQCGSASC